MESECTTCYIRFSAKMSNFVRVGRWTGFKIELLLKDFKKQTDIEQMYGGMWMQAGSDIFKILWFFKVSLLETLILTISLEFSICSHGNSKKYSHIFFGIVKKEDM